MSLWLPGKTILYDVAELAGPVSVVADPLVTIDGVDAVGKTSLTGKLSNTLGCPMVDFDDHIGRRADHTLSSCYSMIWQRQSVHGR